MGRVFRGVIVAAGLTGLGLVGWGADNATAEGRVTKPAPLSASQLVRTSIRSGLRLELKLDVGSVLPEAGLVATFARPIDDGVHSKLGVELLRTQQAALERQKLLARSQPGALRAFRVGNVIGWHLAARYSTLDNKMRRLAAGLSGSCRCPLVWFR